MGIPHRFASSRRDADSAWVQHASGTVRRTSGAEEASSGEWAKDFASESFLLASDFYVRLNELGLEYGQSFRGVVGLYERSGDVIGRVRLPKGCDREGYRVHPVLLDAALQSLRLSCAGLERRVGPRGQVPVGFDRVWLEASVPDELLVKASLRTGNLLDLSLVTPEGQLVGEIHGLKTGSLAGESKRSEARLEECWHEVTWRPAPVPVAQFVPSGTWLFFGAQQHLGASLAAALRAAGQGCITAVAGGSYARLDASSSRIHLCTARLITGACSRKFRLHTGLAAASFTCSPSRPRAMLNRSLVSWPRRRRAGAGAAALVQAVVGFHTGEPPRIAFITRGAQPAAEASGPVCPVQTALWGLAKTVALEHPELRCKCIDLDSSDAESPVFHHLVAELAADDQRIRDVDAEAQVVLRGDGRFVARLRRGEPSMASASEHSALLLERGPDSVFRLEARSLGHLDRLAWCEVVRRAPGPGEVELQVEFAGLNFLDVMKVMGLYPGARGVQLPGAECSGRVLALGEGVTHLRVGDEVIALTSASCSSHVVADARLVVRKPELLTLEEAASVPLVLMTAWYALVHVGRAQRGEKVLIHSATGGTGLAAIQVARHLGLEIFATAGTEAEARAIARDGHRARDGLSKLVLW